MKKQSIIHAKRIGQVGQEVYERLRDRLESRYAGKIVAIDVEHEEYFVGDTLREAIEKGQKKYPEKVFYAIKVGSPAVYSFSGRTPIASTATIATP